jgi:hypothetical protein
MYIQYIHGLCQSRHSTADFALFLVAFVTTAASLEFTIQKSIYTIYKINYVCEEIVAYFPFTGHGPHRN